MPGSPGCTSKYPSVRYLTPNCSQWLLHQCDSVNVEYKYNGMPMGCTSVVKRFGWPVEQKVINASHSQYSFGFSSSSSGVLQ